MSIQEMQDEFEAFCAMEGDRAIDRAAVIRAFVWAWNRSRAAVAIDLPYPGTDYAYDDSDVSGACKHYEAAKDAIESVGLKVKP